MNEVISREVLTILQPAAVEAAVVANELERRHQEEILLALENELEPARYAGHRSEDQFTLADPITDWWRASSSAAGNWPAKGSGNRTAY